MVVHTAEMRHIMHAVASWILLLCFISFICTNFYVNVWIQKENETFELDSTPDHTAHAGSRLLWTHDHNDRKSHNTTLRNFLEAPGRHQTVNLLTVQTPVTDVTTKHTGPWRDLDNFEDDRILEQLQFIPESIKERKSNGEAIPIKKILLYNGFKDWGVKPGRQNFLEQKCPVSHCELTDDRQQSAVADAILFRQDPRFPRSRRPPGQIWILYLLEAPYFTPNLRRFYGQFNWTASYRRDSDIAAPYEKFVKHSKPVLNANTKPVKNYAAGKTKKVAWFVSNCHATNTRIEYAKELSKYIQVDIFGKCGDKKCTRGANSCSDMLNKEYKFYLSFENSNCRDYITEKFYFTGLQHDVIPIVMGAAPEDYRRAAPHYSYIHVDEYTSPRELAEYLNELDTNDELYNEYFKWKGTGSFINTYFWCRVCAMLHDKSRGSTSYGDIEKWWRGRDVCIGKDRWGQHPQRGPYISDYYTK